MTIPFADLLNKAKARLFPAGADSTPAQPRSAPMEKPSSERLSKTVLPNTIRTLGSPDPMKVATVPTPVAKAASASALRPVGANSPPTAARSQQLPRASVLGLEPKVERTISLQLSDILEQMPAGYVKSQESFDPARIISLNAAEIEKGMAESKPSVSLASIYKEAPEIFAHQLSPTESACIPLPYEKVLEQFESLRVRPDQVHDHTVPQLDTPFLKVTREDTERFGTTMEPLQISPLPPVRVEPAIAKTIAAAAPEPIARQTIKGRSPPLLRPSVSLHDPISKKPEAPRTQAPAPAEPKKISLHLPPNGTGVPASERVPASSGPPVPTSLPAPPRAEAPPFTKVTAPSDDLRPKFQRGSPAGPAREVAAASAPPKREGGKIALALNRLLQEVPAFQLNGSPSTVPEDVRVELPLALIEPQLASGRVVIPPKVLQKAMPETYRQLLNIDPAETPISLPLREILENLPATALRLRDDQEETVIAQKFETAFSIKADEDAKRLYAGSGLGPKVSEKPVEQGQVQKKIAMERKNLSAVASTKEEEPEAKSVVVARASVLPGVKEAAVAETSQRAISMKADEEAKRLQAGAEPVPKASEKPVEQAQVQKKIAMERKNLSAVASTKEKEPEAKSVVVARASVIPGVKEAAVAETSQAAISIKADEEAKRLHAGAEPVPKAFEKLAEQLGVQKKIAMERKDVSAVASAEEKPVAKSVVARACTLPGVAACVIAFADDGLSLAGSLPAELAADGLCAMAPSLLQKIDNHMRDAKLGRFTAMTLHCAKSPLTFFMYGNICLTALHAGGELTSETRAELAKMTQELSRTYSQSEPSHVHH
jgi:hypothetical protein